MLQAVKSVQADLNEIRSLTRWVGFKRTEASAFSSFAGRVCVCMARYTRSSWFRTFSVVGSLTLACVLQPWFLFSSTEAGSL